MPIDDKSLDLAGIGKLAKAIPDSVYNQTTKTITTTFEKLIAPITETTSGLGRYIRQKFDTMVDIERALFLYSWQNAINKRAKKNKLSIGHVPAPKTFIKTMEEVSKETDPLLNVLWTNLLYSQLIDQRSHPYFIDILSNLSATEALLLESLNSFDDIGEISKKTILILPHKITSWVNKNGGIDRDWNFSCSLLCEFGLTKTVTPSKRNSGESTVILYRTDIGEEFLKAVTN
jgi:hypothetical protein